MKTKLLLLSLLASFVATTALGQDVIVTREAGKIEAKVLEITDTHVKYRTPSNPDGPIYNIDKNEVRLIEYMNGDVDEFKLVRVAPSKAVIDFSKLSGDLTIRNNKKYWIGDTRVTHRQLERNLSLSPDVLREIRAGRRMKYAAVALGATGGGLIYMGIVFTAAAYDDESTAAGAALITIGAVAGATGVGLGIGSLSKQDKAMYLYNSRRAAGEYGEYDALPGRDAAHLSLAPTSGGIGLQLTF